MDQPALPVLRLLARCYAASASPEDFARGAGFALGRPWPWLPTLGSHIAKAFPGTRPRQRDVVRFLARYPSWQRLAGRDLTKLQIVHAVVGSSRMQPVPAAVAWRVPAIETAGELAQFLSIHSGELEWFADLRALTTGDAGKLSHYRYTVLLKRSGGVRLIEAPKPRLKQLQQQILHEILSAIPPHAAAHGFLRGRSIRSFTEAHLNRRVVLRLDLDDFFPSFRAARIQAFFRTAGYPDQVADRLTGLCTNTAWPDAWQRCGVNVGTEEAGGARELYTRPHLPQGAPTSPALANLCCFRLDSRLAGLAASAGADYTRYADDLAFSGDDEFHRRVERFAAHAAAVITDEGFSVNHHKTRIMRAGVRQKLAGLVVNQHRNLPRPDFDRLKATLTNCVRHGATSQNRRNHPAFRQHLEGRVAFAESVNPEKAERLRGLLEKIAWD